MLGSRAPVAAVAAHRGMAFGCRRWQSQGARVAQPITGRDVLSGVAQISVSRFPQPSPALCAGTVAMPTFQGAVAVFGAAYHFAVQDLRGTAPYWWLANAAMPLVHLLDAETAHVAGVQAAARGWAPIDSTDDPPELATEWLGMTLGNPIGLAAGFDKGGEAVDGMLGMGFGAVEVGSVTPEPQTGNAKPRVFRLAEDGAVVNRYGFNSEGLDTVQGRVVSYMRRRSDNPAALRRLGPVGVNVGKNKEGDAVEDFTRGVRTMAPYADYIVVNVSSPNTPGLRSLQRQEQLQQLITACVQARDGLPWGTSLQRDPPPLLVKVAPDLSDAEIDDICAVALSTGVCRPMAALAGGDNPPWHSISSPHAQELTASLSATRQWPGQCTCAARREVRAALLRLSTGPHTPPRTCRSRDWGLEWCATLPSIDRGAEEGVRPCGACAAHRRRGRRFIGRGRV